LNEGLGEADELNIPENHVAEAHALFLNLQSGDFVQTELNRLRRSGSEEPLDLLKKSNLIKQVEVLGLKVQPLCEEMREVTSSILTRQRTKTFDVKDPVQAQVAERCFEDLTNFSKLRDPMRCGGQAWRSANVTEPVESGLPSVPAMLRWTNDRIPDSLTVIDAKSVHLALRNFSNLLRCMGDKPAAYIGNKEDPILSLARRTPELRDEIYLQIMKQLTDNPSSDSSMKGWKLFASLCGSVLPTGELLQFVKAFLQKMKRGDKGGKDAKSEAARIPAGARKSLILGLQTFAVEKPKLAAQALALLEVTSGQAEGASQKGGSLDGQDLVEVHTEDRTSRSLKYKANMTLEDLKKRMLKVLSLQSGQGFAFFSCEMDEERAPWRLLPSTMDVQTAASKALVGGRCLLFGRVNIMPKEDLDVDDLNKARLTFLHAVKQWLSYPLAMTESTGKSACLKVAAALVAADKTTYAKKKKGKGHERWNSRVTQFKAEFEAGLTGDGVLDRYVAHNFLKDADRAELAQQILALVKNPAGNVNEDGNFELLGKSRALMLMQENLPDFDAYTFGPMREVPPGEFKWSDVKWEFKVAKPPQGGFAPLEARRDMDHHLLVSNAGIELQSVDAVGWSLRLPFRGGMGRWHLNGWGTYEGETLALSFMDRGSGSYEPVGVLLRAPEGMAAAASALLTHFRS